MGEQLSFEGMSIDYETIKLKAAPVAGLGHLRIGEWVEIQGRARCVGVAFEKDAKTGAGVRIHVLGDADLVATEVLTDQALQGIGN